MTISLIVLALCAMEYQISRPNVGTEYNGFGSIRGVIDRTGPAPGRYRVLVPFVVARIPPRWRLAGYLALKWALLALSLLAAYPLLGQAGTLALGILMAATFEFDYWDCYVELAAIALCLYGAPWVVMLAAMAWGASRETVFLSVPLALVAGGPYHAAAALAGVVVWGLVRARQGKAALYSGRWTMRTERLAGWGRLKGTMGRGKYTAGRVMIAAINPYNALDLRRAWERRDTGDLLSLAFSVAAVVVSLSGRLSPVLQGTAWIGLGWVLAAWTLARARETRLLLPVTIWIAGGIINA